MGHDWKYSEDEGTKERCCNKCKVYEIFDLDQGCWVWVSTDEFMDTTFTCSIDEKGEEYGVR